MDIGIIGAGDMGTFYATHFSKTHQVYICDRLENTDRVKEKFDGTNIQVFPDGKLVARRSDLLLFAVETNRLADAVNQYGSAAKYGAAVCSTSAAMSPAVTAFEQLPDDVHRFSCHSLHSPSVKPPGQTLAFVSHRTSDTAYKDIYEVFSSLGSTVVEFPTAVEQDDAMSDVQVIPHLCFESMCSAWRRENIKPWENPAYSSGPDAIKPVMALRIGGGKKHVYRDIAFMNPFATSRTDNYARSTTELYKMEVLEDPEMVTRVKKAAAAIFKPDTAPLLDENDLADLELSDVRHSRKPNTNLSYLAMVDAWHTMGINPYNRLICRTPVFRIWLGMVEYQFRNPGTLDESLATALSNKPIRRDDFAFALSVNMWNQFIADKDVAGYDKEFEDNCSFFREKKDTAKEKSDRLIERLAARQITI